jgi:hypothetical protein
MTTLMRRMGITVLYREPNTSRKAPGQTIHPSLLRTLTITRSNHVWAMVAGSARRRRRAQAAQAAQVDGEVLAGGRVMTTT